jgi:hypothetical protein
MASAAQPQMAVQPVVVGVAVVQPDPIATILQLKGLLDSGAITQEEFDTKKAEQLALM